MDDDRSTTFSVSFMGQNHFMGMVDRDKVSTIVLVNKVMKLVYKRKMTWDERFKLTVTQPWDNLLLRSLMMMSYSICGHDIAMRASTT